MSKIEVRGAAGYRPGFECL